MQLMTETCELVLRGESTARAVPPSSRSSCAAAIHWF